MIKTLSIKNFQSHRDTVLEFDPGVNVIVGTSDSGKTAIIRALRWLLTNRPTGDGFRSHWGGDTLVGLLLDSGKLIQRVKTKSDNMYVYTGGVDQENTEFKAFGTEPPEEILIALNINEINLQAQLDRPFLLDSSPGEVAQHFNRVAGLDKIDSSIKYISSWLRQINNTLEFEHSQLGKLREQLNQFNNLPQVEAIVETMEITEGNITTKYQQIQGIRGLKNKIYSAESQLKEQAVILQAEPLVKKYEEIANQRKEKLQSLENITDITYTINRIKNSIAANTNLISVESTLTQFQGFIQEQKEKQSWVDSLRNLVHKITSIKTELQTESTLLKSLEDTFRREMPEICPLCGK